MRRAIISVENPTFYTDAGISPAACIRASSRALRTRPRSGAAGRVKRCPIG